MPRRKNRARKASEPSEPYSPPVAMQDDSPLHSALDFMFANVLSRGRCTEADIDRATDSIARLEITPGELLYVPFWETKTTKVGHVVWLVGLKGRADLNGACGRVTSFVDNEDGSFNRFGVTLDSGETISVRGTNLADEAPEEEGVASVLSEAVGSDAAGVICGFLTCTRCQQPCAPGSKCIVPHPTHMRQECGACFGPHGMESHYYCSACDSQYTEKKKEMDDEPTIAGPKYCFEGRHTSRPLPESDMRRVWPHTASLVAGPGLQAEIDALPDDTATLTIVSGGLYDEENAFTLERSLPSLTKVQLVDVAWDRIVLNEELTPNVRSLRLQNVPDDCELELVLPELRDVSIHFWGGGDETINRMLEAATRLESFDSYKLWVGSLRFASNALQSVDLHRSDSLQSLTLWAPNLRNLGLQACYALDRLRFLTEHPLRAELPAGHAAPQLEVNTLNSNLGRGAKRALAEHPNVVKSKRTHQGMATEAMFAGMGGMMGGGFFGGGDEDEEDDDYEDDEDEDEDEDDEGW